MELLYQITAILEGTPSSTARDIAYAIRDSKVSRSDVNRQLYAHPELFRHDDRQPPRWTLVPRPQRTSVQEIETEDEAFDRLRAALDSADQGRATSTLTPVGAGATQDLGYGGLRAFLRRQRMPYVELEFAELEREIGRDLPASAFRHRAWWANQRDGGHTQARAWMDEGWSVAALDLKTRRVAFKRDIAVVETRHGHPIALWQEAKEEAKHVLAARARQGSTIDYSDLVRSISAIQLGPDSPALAAMLGEISKEEDFAGRGMLSVVVVHKDGDKMPGAGFFDLARQLGRDVSDELVCWASEMSRVQEAWSTTRRRR